MNRIEARVTKTEGERNVIRKSEAPVTCRRSVLSGAKRAPSVVSARTRFKAGSLEYRLTH